MKKLADLRALVGRETKEEWEINLFNPLRIVIDNEEGQELVAMATTANRAALIVLLRNNADTLIAVAEAAETIEEKADNYLHAALLPVPPRIHAEGLLGGMKEIKEMATAALAALRGGEEGGWKKGCDRERWMPPITD